MAQTIQEIQGGCEHTSHPREYCYPCWDAEAWVDEITDELLVTGEIEGDLILRRRRAKHSQSTILASHPAVRMAAEEALALLPEVIDGPVDLLGADADTLAVVDEVVGR